MSAQTILSESFYRSPAFYGPGSQILAQNDSCTIFKMENKTGEGIMTRYPVLPGMELIYNDMHITTVRANQNKVPCEDIMEINHCREGRFECEFADGGAVYLGAGDLSANMLTHPPRDSWFPLSHYHGISVMVDLRAAQDTLYQISQIFDSIPIDLYALRDRLCGENSCFIIRATDAIQHIFSELYAAPSAIHSDYRKLKVLELLLFLNSADLPALREKRTYITRTQADTVRAIRTYPYRRRSLPSPHACQASLLSFQNRTVIFLLRKCWNSLRCKGFNAPVAASPTICYILYPATARV